MERRAVAITHEQPQQQQQQLPLPLLPPQQHSPLLSAQQQPQPHHHQQQQQQQQSMTAVATAAAAAAASAAAAAASGPAAGAMPVVASNSHQQRPKRDKAWYLDAPENDASKALLSELGIVFYELHMEPNSTDLDMNNKLWSLAQSRLALKPKSGVDGLDRGAIQIGELPATALTLDDMEDQGGEARFDSLEGMYCVWGGEAFVDVRDWADCWVRIRLKPGEVVLIPPNRFHRATPKRSGTRLVQVRVKTGDGGVNVEIRDPRTVPPPGSSGTMEGDPRELIVNLCRQFYHVGWVTGTGGSISIRHGNRVFMTPSGVQKERLRASDLFVLDRTGAIISHPWASRGSKRLKISACHSLFQHAYRLRNAGAVIHSHGIYCVLAGLSCERRGVNTFRITHQEMIKGMEGHGYHDELVIPVIQNTAKEEDLADSLADAITRYPKSNAVLVQRHGCYVWGPTWEKAKTQSECLHYLLEVAVRMEGSGFDPQAVPSGEGNREGGYHECGVGKHPSPAFSLASAEKNSRGGGCESGMETAPSPGGAADSNNGDKNYHGGRDRSPRKASNAVAEVKVTQGGPFGIHGSGVEGAQSGVARAGVMSTTAGDAKRQRFSSADSVGDVAGNNGALSAAAAAAASAAAASAAWAGTAGGALHPTFSLDGVRVVLLDIEGTTTPITFVHEILFPYARKHLAQHLRENWGDAALQSLVHELKAQSEIDARSGTAGANARVPQVLEAADVGVERAQASVVDYVRFVMDSDRKLGPMKSLQGHVWRRGYADGGLRGEVYADVEPALRRWVTAGKRVAIYSSGSREAQRLLFSNSIAGDLRQYLSVFFDTSIGSKREPSSYSEICLSLGVDNPSEILFVTDLFAEAEAARIAELRVVLSVRPGNSPLPQGHHFTIVHDLSAIG